MKQILESSEAFTAYATIDAGIFMLNKLSEEYNRPISPLESMIDKATGYEEERKNAFKAKAKEIVADIIAAKKVLEYDTTNDENFFKGIDAL